jgi:hypothetical protein
VRIVLREEVFRVTLIEVGLATVLSAAVQVGSTDRPRMTP